MGKSSLDLSVLICSDAMYKSGIVPLGRPWFDSINFKEAHSVILEHTTSLGFELIIKFSEGTWGGFEKTVWCHDHLYHHFCLIVYSRMNYNFEFSWLWYWNPMINVLSNVCWTRSILSLSSSSYDTEISKQLNNSIKYFDRDTLCML